MRATRAYIASAGTAAVMLGAALSLFALLSAFIAFGSWPGDGSKTSVDQIVLTAAQHHQSGSVAVSRNAVALAQLKAAKQRAANARRHGAAGAHTPSTATIGGTGQAVASAPAQAGGTAGSGGGGNGPGPDQLTKQVNETTKQIQSTTQQTTQQVQNTATDVQNQVNDIVGGGGGGGTPANSAGGAVQGAQDTAGSVLGH